MKTGGQALPLRPDREGYFSVAFTYASMAATSYVRTEGHSDLDTCAAAVAGAVLALVVDLGPARDLGIMESPGREMGDESVVMTGVDGSARSGSPRGVA